MLSHLAPAKEPHIHIVIFFSEELDGKKCINKLDSALKIIEIAIPAKINLLLDPTPPI